MRCSWFTPLAVVSAIAGAQTNSPGTRVDSALRQLESQGFSGVALVAKDGRVLLENGYGFANRAEVRASCPKR